MFERRYILLGILLLSGMGVTLASLVDAGRHMWANTNVPPTAPTVVSRAVSSQDGEIDVVSVLREMFVRVPWASSPLSVLRNEQAPWVPDQLRAAWEDVHAWHSATAALLAAENQADLTLRIQQISQMVSQLTPAGTAPRPGNETLAAVGRVQITFWTAVQKSQQLVQEFNLAFDKGDYSCAADACAEHARQVAGVGKHPQIKLLDKDIAFFAERRPEAEALNKLFQANSALQAELATTDTPGGDAAVDRKISLLKRFGDRFGGSSAEAQELAAVDVHGIGLALLQEREYERIALQEERAAQGLITLLNQLEKEPLDLRLKGLWNQLDSLQTAQAPRLVKDKLTRWLTAELRNKKPPLDLDGVQEVIAVNLNAAPAKTALPPGSPKKFASRLVLGAFRQEETSGLYLYWPSAQDRLANPTRPGLWYATQAVGAKLGWMVPIEQQEMTRRSGLTITAFDEGSLPERPLAAKAIEEYNKAVDEVRRDVFSAAGWETLAQCCREYEPLVRLRRECLREDPWFVYPANYAAAYRDLTFAAEGETAIRVRNVLPMADEILKDLAKNKDTVSRP